MSTPHLRSEAAAPLTILLVDDSEDCLSTLEMALQIMPGVLICTRHTAEGALEVLSRGNVSAVITDVHLPTMSGLELISWIRREPGLQALPIVVVSADADPWAPRTAIESGANAFFLKPFSPAVVRKKLEELIHAV